MPSLDKENSTGLLGKYEMQNSYLKATKLLVEGKTKEASELFVETAKNGREAKALYQSKTYDVIITDILCRMSTVTKSFWISAAWG
jgi:CheY-like chemotaxis protein